MLGLPQSTLCNRKVPKQKFYDNIDCNAEVKREFVDKIDSIYWRNKIAPATMNISAGTKINEIEIFEVALKAAPLDVSLLRKVDKAIPYSIIFVLSYNDEYQAWVDALKDGRYYHTQWMAESELPLHVDGYSTDEVYDNFVRQIAGGEIASKKGETLEESIARCVKINALKKQVKSLNGKMRHTAQVNKQVQLNGQVKRLLSEIKRLEGDQ